MKYRTQWPGSVPSPLLSWVLPLSAEPRPALLYVKQPASSWSFSVCLRLCVKVVLMEEILAGYWAWGMFFYLLGQRGEWKARSWVPAWAGQQGDQAFMLHCMSTATQDLPGLSPWLGPIVQRGTQLQFRAQRAAEGAGGGTAKGTFENQPRKPDASFLSSSFWHWCHFQYRTALLKRCCWLANL